MVHGVKVFYKIHLDGVRMETIFQIVHHVMVEVNKSVIVTPQLWNLNCSFTKTECRSGDSFLMMDSKSFGVELNIEIYN